VTVLQPIGRIRTPFATVDDCPRNVRALDPAPICTVEVFAPYRDGLQSLATFSHVILLYWLDRAERAQMVFTPPFDAQPRGIFATRAPHRPNPIGLAVAALDGIDGRVLRVRYLDCVDGTALLDIKPYLPSVDAVPDASMGWLRS
jgi:tRNA (adenine37-N6)-methyltransferase